MYVPVWGGHGARPRNRPRLGLGLPPLEKKNLFRFLEMPTLSAEGLPAIWEEIVRNIDEAGVRRLGIASFTPMSPAFRTRGDIRAFTHTLPATTIQSALSTAATIT